MNGEPKSSLPSKTSPYAKPEVLLGDLRDGICSSGLCRQLRAVAADEIERHQGLRLEGNAYIADLQLQRDRLRARLLNRINLCACHYGSSPPGDCATCKADREALL